jgi:hypothetical protein
MKKKPADTSEDNLKKEIEARIPIVSAYQDGYKQAKAETLKKVKNEITKSIISIKMMEKKDEDYHMLKDFTMEELDNNSIGILMELKKDLEMKG